MTNAMWSIINRIYVFQMYIYRYIEYERFNLAKFPVLNLSICLLYMSLSVSVEVYQFQ